MLFSFLDFILIDVAVCVVCCLFIKSVYRVNAKQTELRVRTHNRMRRMTSDDSDESVKRHSRYMHCPSVKRALFRWPGSIHSAWLKAGIWSQLSKDERWALHSMTATSCVAAYKLPAESWRRQIKGTAYSLTYFSRRLGNSCCVKQEITPTCAPLCGNIKRLVKSSCYCSNRFFCFTTLLLVSETCFDQS